MLSQRHWHGYSLTTALAISWLSFHYPTDCIIATSQQHWCLHRCHLTTSLKASFPADICNKYYHLENKNCQLGSTFVAKSNLKYALLRGNRVWLSSHNFTYAIIALLSQNLWRHQGYPLTTALMISGSGVSSHNITDYTCSMALLSQQYWYHHGYPLTTHWWYLCSPLTTSLMLSWFWWYQDSPRTTSLMLSWFYACNSFEKSQTVKHKSWRAHRDGR
jgi:hypothetical protein